MKILITVFILFFLYSCSQSNKDSITRKLEENKNTINRLRKENREIEKQLLKLQNDSNIQKIPVRTVIVEPTHFKHYIKTSGIIEAVEIASISPEVPAQITTILVKEGQSVKRGELMVSLNSNVISKAINELEVNLQLAETVYQRQKNLWDQKIGSEVEYLKAKSNKESLENALASQKAQLALYSVEAPFSGIVDQISGKEGELSSPGYPILKLVNLSKVKINTDISEIYLPNVSKGDTVQVSFPTYSNLTLSCPVYRTGNIINPDNRTFNVQILLNNIDNKLKPNMMATVTINDYSIKNALIVPSTIIKNDIHGKFIFIDDDGIAKKIYVQTGMSYEDQTVLTSGINAGYKVITEGFNTVSNGSYIIED